MLEGYAADTRSSAGSGLNERDIQVHGGDGEIHPFTLIGFAQPRQPSPAAAATLGSQFGQSGFRLIWESCTASLGEGPERVRLNVWVSSLTRPGAIQRAHVDLEILPCAPGTVIWHAPFDAEPDGVAAIALAERQIATELFAPLLGGTMAAGIDVRCAPQAAACVGGLIFAAREELPGLSLDEDRRLLFAITPQERRYQLVLHTAGEPLSASEVFARGTSPVIRSDGSPNRVAVVVDYDGRMQAPLVRLFVNGQQVDQTYSLAAGAGGRLGIIGARLVPAQPTVVLFDNLTVSTPAPLNQLGPVLRGE
jgi:hypothetical protein